MSNDARGPEATNVSLPACDHLGVAAHGRGEHVRAELRRGRAHLAEASSETLEQSTMSFGEPPLSSRPSGPVHTAFKSSEADTVVNTMSQPRARAALSTIFAPSSASGSTLVRVRL